MNTAVELAPAKKELRVITPNLGTNRSGPTTQELIEEGNAFRRSCVHSAHIFSMITVMGQGKKWSGEVQGQVVRPDRATQAFGKLLIEHQRVGDSRSI